MQRQIHDVVVRLFRLNTGVEIIFVDQISFNVSNKTQIFKFILRKI